jgi:lipoprotein-anchoring transpeptidase ErfK/SrfK
MRTAKLSTVWVLVLFAGLIAIGGVIRRHLASAHSARSAHGASETPAGGPAAKDMVQTQLQLVAIPEEQPSRSETGAVSPDQSPAPATVETFPRPVANWLEAQIELARRGFSSGSIDGVVGSQSISALKAFQESAGLPVTGALDPATRASLALATPPIAPVTLTAEDLAGLEALSPTWLGKSQQTALAYENALEMVAERTHAHPALIQQLNPTVDWSVITPETAVSAPAVGHVAIRGKAFQLHISLDDHVLEVRDDSGNLIAHFPVSIARDVEKRPAGELRVTVVIPDPNYTFDPDVFPESEDARELGRRLIIPPGPNNPVGVAWIGLDRPGYGIHGTPFPEQVGRTESHGCFRLANWDALTLLDLAWVGLPVIVEP